ncbi:MAG: A24 family peptidase [Clostridiales bacterium]|nr:A24 family peptidase [Clostridiales bacterium]
MVNEMDMFLVIVIGLLSGVVGMVAIPLSLFIKKVEDGTVCEQCVDEKSCFAKQPLKRGKSDWLNEFMLVSYYKVRKKCTCCVDSERKTYILYLFFHVILMGFLFWSKGMSTVNILYVVSTAALLSLSVVDWNTQYIPLEMSGILFICGLIHMFMDLSNWLDYAIGLFVVSGFLFLIDKISTPILKKRYAKEGMEIDGAIGGGDIKLMAATGLLLGWKLNFLALMIGCVAGSVIHLMLMKIKRSGRQFALGPYLSLGVYITMICGEQLVSWYLSVLGLEALIINF